MKVTIDQKNYNLKVEEGWKVRHFNWFIDEEILNLMFKKMEIMDILVDRESKLRTLVVENDREEIITFPYVKRNGERKSIQEVVQIQDYKWYCKDRHLNIFVKVCEKYDIDVIGINIDTGKKGKPVAKIETDGINRYIKSLDYDISRQMEKLKKDVMPLIEWKEVDRGTEEWDEWLKLIISNVMDWNRRYFEELRPESVGILLVLSYVKQYVECIVKIGLNENGKIMMGKMFDDIVGSFILVEGENTLYSFLACRNKDFDEFSMGHIMQLRKVEVLLESDKKYLSLGGTLDKYPHKKKWSTEVGETGAVGIGYL